jgi:hypothetical protein
MVFLYFLFSFANGLLRVIEPPSLNKFDTSQSNFGNPIETFLIGSVQYISEYNFGCTAIPPLNSSIYHPDSNPILLLDRGKCGFVTKVRNAQAAGASAVIFANDKDEDPQGVMINDDGTAGDITIPSVLISLNGGKN